MGRRPCVLRQGAVVLLSAEIFNTAAILTDQLSSDKDLSA